MGANHLPEIANFAVLVSNQLKLRLFVTIRLEHCLLIALVSVSQKEKKKKYIYIYMPAGRPAAWAPAHTITRKPVWRLVYEWNRCLRFAVVWIYIC